MLWLRPPEFAVIVAVYVPAGAPVPDDHDLSRVYHWTTSVSFKVSVAEFNVALTVTV